MIPSCSTLFFLSSLLSWKREAPPKIDWFIIMTRRGHAGQLVLLFWALWDLFCAPLRHYASAKRSSTDDDVGYLAQQQKWTIFKSRIDFDSQPSGETYRHSSEDCSMKQWYSMISSDDYWTRTGHDKSCRNQSKTPRRRNISNGIARAFASSILQNQSDIRNRNAEKEGRNTRNPFYEIPTVVCNCVVATPREQGRFTCLLPPSPHQGYRWWAIYELLQAESEATPSYLLKNETSTPKQEKNKTRSEKKREYLHWWYGILHEQGHSQFGSLIREWFCNWSYFWKMRLNLDHR